VYTIPRQPIARALSQSRAIGHAGPENPPTPVADEPVVFWSETRVDEWVDAEQRRLDASDGPVRGLEWIGSVDSPHGPRDDGAPRHIAVSRILLRDKE
jgi:hypothetical protein